MLKKLMLSAVAMSMIFVFTSNEASAGGKDCCCKCERVKVCKVRCPKVKCAKLRRHDCCSPVCTTCTSSCSSCSGNHVSDGQHITPVADPGPAPAHDAAVSAEPAPAAPAPSAADAVK